MEFIDHGLGVRPVGLVKLPVALHSPVEEIDYDLIDLNPFLLILPGDGQDLVLGAVAQLALPQAHQVFREHGRAPGDGGILRENTLRMIARGDPVIHLSGGFGDPFRLVRGKGHPADGGIVPQEAVAEGGNHEGNGNLAVSLGQFQHRALQVQVRLLILPHAVDLLAFIGVKAHG